VGLMESLLTAKLVDDLTDTHSDKTRESLGQGAANVVTGFFGGMGGCAMIGQTMINVKQAGARTRVSSFLAGVFLIVLSVSLSDLVGQIPMAALVAVMLVVAFTTFDWNSVRTLRVMPVSETVVLLVTVVSTVVTDNLAVGVILGVITAMVAFARRVAHLTRVDRVGGEGSGRYRVDGQLFFASSNDLVYQFDYVGDPDEVTVDFSAATVWDSSTVAALQGVREQYARRGKSVTFTGLDAMSRGYIDRLEGRLD
jgi:SulP family sulfate permease